MKALDDPANIPMNSQDHPAYRPDIDGLRAIAVLSVVIFHAFPKALHGGFIGVDIFFVISGYLISTIIYKGLDAGTFSLRDFYTRRIRRIFPALLVVLAFCIVFGWHYLLSDEYQQLGKHVAWGAAFSANFALRQEVGYFDISSDLKPLLHLWSLAIEEQFYIAWPLLLILAYRLHLNLLPLLALLGITSFALGMSTLRINTTDAFYLPHLRAWELLLGSTLAHFTLYQNKRLDEAILRIVFKVRPSDVIIANIKGWGGLTLVLFSAFYIKQTYSFPGWWALFPVLGAALIIDAGMHAWVNQKLLAHKWLIRIGLISYPLYLWHWPLLAFARIMSGGEPSGTLRALLVLVAFGLAYITYALIEKKIRFSRAKFTTGALVTGLALMGISGYYLSHHVTPKLAQFDKIGRAAGDWEYHAMATWLPAPVGGGIVDLPSPTPGKVLFYGDSNIEQYWSRVHQLILDAPEHTKSALFVTQGGCPPILGIEDAKNSDCGKRNEYAINRAMSSDIDTVVIAASWWVYFGESNKTVGRYSLQGEPIHHNTKGYSSALNSLQSMIANLKSNGKSVFLILNMPRGEAVDPKAMLSRTLSGTTLNSDPLDLEELLKPVANIHSDLRKLGADAGAIIIDPLHHMCEDGKCPVITADGEPIFKDGSHIRPGYARHHATFIDPTLAP